jgi:hypothetical protein
MAQNKWIIYFHGIGWLLCVLSVVWKKRAINARGLFAENWGHLVIMEL